MNRSGRKRGNRYGKRDCKGVKGRERSEREGKGEERKLKGDERDWERGERKGKERRLLKGIDRVGMGIEGKERGLEWE